MSWLCCQFGDWMLHVPDRLAQYEKVPSGFISWAAAAQRQQHAGHELFAQCGLLP